MGTDPEMWIQKDAKGVKRSKPLHIKLKNSKKTSHIWYLNGHRSRNENVQKCVQRHWPIKKKIVHPDVVPQLQFLKSMCKQSIIEGALPPAINAYGLYQIHLCWNHPGNIKSRRNAGNNLSRRIGIPKRPLSRFEELYLWQFQSYLCELKLMLGAIKLKGLECGRDFT